MVLDSYTGVHIPHKSKPRVCRVEHERSEFSVPNSRITDMVLADEAAFAVWGDNVVKIGVNAMTAGIIIRRRDYFVEVYTTKNQTLALLKTQHDVAMYILACLRRPDFRVIAFGDPRRGRPYSQLRPHSIDFTDGVARRRLDYEKNITSCKHAPATRAPRHLLYKI
jgi:hypothetical protein